VAATGLALLYPALVWSRPLLAITDIRARSISFSDRPLKGQLGHQITNAPRFMAGGPGNPLGARAMYLGTTVYRIHGTNRPDTIGTAVSSGCFRLVNTDVADL
jgi:hypothetical protein